MLYSVYVTNQFTRKHDHISPILRSLHWLPVDSRIIFKILLLVYKTTHNLAPQYLQDLISLRSSSAARPLGSSSKQLTQGPRTKTRYGDRAFACIAPPSGTNSLPIFKMPQQLTRSNPFLKPIYLYCNFNWYVGGAHE